MKNQALGIVSLLTTFILAIWVYLHPARKIGFVETATILAEFSEAKVAKKQFESLQMEWDRNLKKLNDTLLHSMSTLKSDFEMASPAKKKSLSEDFEKRQSDYQRYVDAVRKMSQEKEQSLMEPVVKKVNAFIDDWGRKNGYAIILGTASGGNIVQADPELNLTLSILKEINEMYKDLPNTKPIEKSVPDSSNK